MPDDRIRDALRELDRPVRPDPAFAEQLFDRLREEAEGGRTRPTRGGSSRRRPNLRRAVLVAAVLAVGMAIVLTLIAPLRDLRTSEPGAGISDTTPFRLTLDGSFPASSDADVGGTFSIRISWRSADEWRIDVLGGSAPDQPLVNENVGARGSSAIWSNGTLSAIDGASGQPVPQIAHAAWFSPLNLLGYDDPRSGWRRACEGGASLGDSTIDGRPVVGVRCSAPPGFGSTSATVEVWRDVDSGLILKLASGPDPGQQLPPGPIAWYRGESVEATSIEYDPLFPDDAFRAPSPSATPQAPSPVTAVAVGDPLPTFTGRTLDGGSFDAASLGGTPTAIWIWADWCGPCVGTPLDEIDRLSRTRTDVDVITVAWNADPDSIRTFVRDHEYSVPVVQPDDPQALQNAWGLSGTPTLLLVDASGRLVGAYAGWNAELGKAADVRAVVDALASGSQLPDGTPAFTSSETS